METITLDTVVEQLVEQYPAAIEYGILHGVRFMFCVGAYPTTLGDLLAVKKVAAPQAFVDGLNEFLRTKDEVQGKPGS
jgi:hypothetical protein